MGEKGLVGIVLGAGKIVQELMPIFGDIPTALMPINGKPVLFLIIDYLRSLGIRKMYISVGHKKEKVIKLLNVHSGTGDFDLCPVSVDPSKRPGNALFRIIKSIPDEEKRTNTFYLNLADTLLLRGTRFPCDRNFVVASTDYMRSERWCVIERCSDSNCVRAIYNKQKDKEGLLAIVGNYHFADLTNFDDLTEGDYEISRLLGHLLDKNIPLEIIETEDWCDFGHLEKYYQAKRSFLSPRAYNKLQADKFTDTIIKRSDRGDILKSEILWYLKIPKELKVYVPRIIDCNIEDEQQIYAEFEFYGYPSLAELWLYGGLNKHIWKVIIDRMFVLLNKFLNHRHKVCLDDYVAMYVQKTKDRASLAYKSNAKFRSLFEAESLIINGQRLKGWPFFKKHLDAFAEKLYSSKDNCLLHGDLCFSNILFDLNYGVMKLIDPRGSWGSLSLYGDIKYDVAKLRHSVSGLYDHIVNDHINLSFSYPEDYQNGWLINLQFPLRNETYKSVKEYFDHKVGELWNLNQIKLIEGLLFISMIPLHEDSKKRQLAMFARGISLLNESYDKELGSAK